MNTSTCTLQQWRIQANRALSSMLLDLPGTSKMRVRMEGCSLEVKIEFEIMAPEQSNISKKKSIPPSKIRRNRKRLEMFLKKRLEQDGDGKSTEMTTENVEKTNLEISSEAPARTVKHTRRRNYRCIARPTRQFCCKPPPSPHTKK